MFLFFCEIIDYMVYRVTGVATPRYNNTISLNEQEFWMKKKPVDFMVNGKQIESTHLFHYQKILGLLFEKNISYMAILIAYNDYVSISQIIYEKTKFESKDWDDMRAAYFFMIDHYQYLSSMN